jgi:hypothetical protein
VLSGSLDGWGDPVIPHFDLVVFLHTAQAIRLQRLRVREARRFGADAVAPRHQETKEFIEWASRYDDGGLTVRSLQKHQPWLAALPCRVRRLDGARPVPELVEDVITAITPVK